MSLAAQEHHDRFTIADEPGFLRAWISGGIVFVYRSVLVKDDSPLFKPVMRIVGARPPSTVDVVSAPEMMFKRAEWLLYEL